MAFLGLIRKKIDTVLCNLIDLIFKKIINKLISDYNHLYNNQHRNKSERDFVVPALLGFVSAAVERTVLCEAEGLHFPPRSGQPRSTIYEPIPGTAEQTPGERRGVRFLFCNVALIPHV